jgi:hypothetical protein
VEEMLELDLDLDEREILSDIIETVLADLRMEIGRTDRKDFRDMLKKRKQVLQKTLAWLRGERFSDIGDVGRGVIST